MSSRRPTAAGASAPTSSRQNEYFVPRDGIDREVITADICRYLGNDALVRPGTYENPSTGQIIQGYFINAYRNLTTAMIEDLKADSARWDQERRQHSAARSSAGGTLASRDSNPMHARQSNSPAVQYRNSETHSSRQQFGPSDGASGYPGQDSRDQYGSGPRYPGTGNLGYTGASSGNFQSQGYGSQAPPYGGAQPFAQSPPHQQQQSNMPPYPGHGQAPSGQFAGQGQYPPYQDVGANSMVRPGPGGDTQMGGYDAYSRDARGAPVPSGSSRPAYSSSGPPTAQGYQTAGGNQGFYPPNQQAGQGFAQPHDPFYGRGGFAQDTQQYEAAPAPSRTPTSTAAPSVPPTAPSSSHRRERDSVERDPRHSSHRHTSDRHGSRRTGA